MGDEDLIVEAMTKTIQDKTVTYDLHRQIEGATKLSCSQYAKAIVANSLLMKQQLIVVNRSRRRAPNLTVIDRLLLGFWSLFLSPHPIQRAAVILKPTTRFKFHDILKKRKYRLLYTARRKGKPGPKGPSQELIDAIVEMKRRNSRFGCPRIAQEINKAF